MHKDRFLPRQLRTIAYSCKYVITMDDITKHQKASQAKNIAEQTKKTEAEIRELIEDLVDDFDPENDIIDRRLLFEVTRKRLIEGEFADEETSSEEQRQEEDL